MIQSTSYRYSQPYNENTPTSLTLDKYPFNFHYCDNWHIHCIFVKIPYCCHFNIYFLILFVFIYKVVISRLLECLCDGSHSISYLSIMASVLSLHVKKNQYSKIVSFLCRMKINQYSLLNSNFIFIFLKLSLVFKVWNFEKSISILWSWICKQTLTEYIWKMMSLKKRLSLIFIMHNTSKYKHSTVI